MWTGNYIKKGELVDVFIPTISNHIPYIRRALGSIFFQEYEPLRIILWIEDPGQQPDIESFLNEFWYEPHERKPSPESWVEPVLVEYCSKGVLVRNYQGRTGNAWRARQWIFEWEDKSDYVKMLDDDDILLPGAITVMMQYMKDDIDAVFHPLVSLGCNRIGSINTDITGAAQMLMRKKTMRKIIDLGFRWDKDHDDPQFYQFFKSHDFKWAMTKETGLYLYIKP